MSNYLRNNGIFWLNKLVGENKLDFDSSVNGSYDCLTFEHCRDLGSHVDFPVHASSLILNERRINLDYFQMLNRTSCSVSPFITFDRLHFVTSTAVIQMPVVLKINVLFVYYFTDVTNRRVYVTYLMLHNVMLQHWQIAKNQAAVSNTKKK